jgi:L-aminopeptidase/D-esterase-like protein
VSDGPVAPDAPFVAGLRVGHATDHAARTGCTVLLGPFRGGVHVAGMATASRELALLTPLHIAPFVDAVLLAGGSAYGLAAADGVMAWLEADGAGFATPAARVPIVPAAALYDLGVGRADVRPDAAMGRAACAAARAAPPDEGRVGAGAGATVGKVLGMGGAEPGGFGCAVVACGAATVGAFAVVNAFGDVLGEDGRIIAGARGRDGRFADAAALLRHGALTTGAAGPDTAPPPPGTNTTLAAVVVDAALDRPALDALARMAAAALGRRIAPVHTPFDGDIVFALSTAVEPVPAPLRPERLLELGAAAAHALAQAIERAMTVDGADG